MDGQAIKRAAERCLPRRGWMVPGSPACPLTADRRTCPQLNWCRMALHARLTAAGWGALGGHKIGCTTPVMQAFLGIDHPCAGGVFARIVQHRHGAFRRGDFRHVGVECEITVRLAADLPRLRRAVPL